MTVLALINLLIMFFILILVQSSTLVFSLPSGAPHGSCLSQSPQHFSSPRAPHSSPFVVRAFAKREGPKTVVPVSIVPRGFGQTFRGFIVEARLASNPAVIVDGDFVPGEGALSRTFTCGSGNRHANTMTHSNANPKPRISAVWIPPEGFRDPVLFKTTIVATKDTYWEDQLSDRVDLAARAPPPPAQHQPSLVQQQPMVPVAPPMAPAPTPEQPKNQEMLEVEEGNTVLDILAGTFGMNPYVNSKGDAADAEESSSSNNESTVNATKADAGKVSNAANESKQGESADTTPVPSSKESEKLQSKTDEDDDDELESKFDELDDDDLY